MSGSTPVLTPRSDTGSLEGRAPSPASAEKGMSCFTDGTMLVVGSHKTLARVVARTETVSRSCQPKGRPPTFLWHPLSHAQRRLAKEMPQRTATKWSPLREVPSKRGPLTRRPWGSLTQQTMSWNDSVRHFADRKAKRRPTSLFIKEQQDIP